MRQNPELLEADRQTLFDACLTLAKRGLLPDKKQAAMVVFNTKINGRWVKMVQALAMVEGIILEMGKAGVAAYAVSVYANEKIRVWNDDLGQHVDHEVIPFGDKGTRLGAFAAGRDADGRTYVEAMDMVALDRVALRSKQARKDNDGKPIGRGGTWVSDPERMEQKSCLHRLRKRIPILAGTGGDDDDFDTSVSLEPTPEGQGSPVPGDSQEPSGDVPQTTKSGRRRPRALSAVIDAVTEQTPAPAAAPSPKEPEPVTTVEDDFREGDIL